MIAGKILLQGRIHLISPLALGSGASEYTDMDVLVDEKGTPYIPATSLVGVLRHYIELKDDLEKKENYFWGHAADRQGDSGKTSGHQSAMACSDLLLDADSQATIRVRDGIRIDNKTGIVEEGAKYDYQVVEPGIKFDLNIEVTYRQDNKEFCQRMVETIRQILKEGKIRVGAMTNNGMGKIKLVESKIHHYNLTGNPQHVLKWLKGEDSGDSFDVDPFEIEKKEFILEGTFKVRTSLIVRSYSTSPQAPDAVHIKSSGKNVLPGSSLKGAIRARAERIVNTLSDSEDKAQDLLHKLFGYAPTEEEEKSEKDPICGRVQVEETVLEGLAAEMQTRIKIDRFTGGTIETALFDTEPVFQQFDDDPVQSIKLKIDNYEDFEVGLILLVIKDLWTGDLPVGGEKNVGRGVFEGVEVSCQWDDQEVQILSGKGELQIQPQERKADLEQMVEALQERLGG